MAPCELFPPWARHSARSASGDTYVCRAPSAISAPRGWAACRRVLNGVVASPQRRATGAGARPCVGLAQRAAKAAGRPRGQLRQALRSERAAQAGRTPGLLGAAAARRRRRPLPRARGHHCARATGGRVSCAALLLPLGAARLGVGACGLRRMGTSASRAAVYFLGAGARLEARRLPPSRSGLRRLASAGGTLVLSEAGGWELMARSLGRAPLHFPCLYRPAQRY